MPETAPDLAALDTALASLTQDELLSLPTIATWLERHATNLRVTALPLDLQEDASDYGFDLWLDVRRTAPGRWAVKDREYLRLMDDGTWEDQGMNSDRTEEYKRRSTGTLRESIARAEVAAANLTRWRRTVPEIVALIRERQAELAAVTPET